MYFASISCYHVHGYKRVLKYENIPINLKLTTLYV